MSISNEERQKRIDLIEAEKQAIKKLNDLSQIKSRVETEESLVIQSEILDDDDQDKMPLKKIANPDKSPNL